MNARTLVLNKNWQPINIIDAFEAVQKVFKGRAQIVDVEINTAIRDVCLNVLSLHKYLNNKKEKK